MDNLGFDAQDVASAHRVWPPQFVDAEANHALSKIQRLHEEPHGHRRRMPAARNQSFENGSIGAFAVEMKHLRVKLVRELDKLLFRYVEPFRFKAVTCFQIVEIMLLHLKTRAPFMIHCS